MLMLLVFLGRPSNLIHVVVALRDLATRCEGFTRFSFTVSSLVLVLGVQDWIRES